MRLDQSIAAALAEHCAATGATKSHVVQRALAVYLVNDATVRASASTAGVRKAARPSAAYSAFEQAGLIGTGTGDRASADKAAVRRRVTGAA